MDNEPLHYKYICKHNKAFFLLKGNALCIPSLSRERQELCGTPGCAKLAIAGLPTKTPEIAFLAHRRGIGNSGLAVAILRASDCRSPSRLGPGDLVFAPAVVSLSQRGRCCAPLLPLYGRTGPYRSSTFPGYLWT